MQRNEILNWSSRLSFSCYQCNYNLSKFDLGFKILFIYSMPFWITGLSGSSLSAFYNSIFPNLYYCFYKMYSKESYIKCQNLTFLWKDFWVEWIKINAPFTNLQCLVIFFGLDKYLDLVFALFRPLVILNFSQSKTNLL